MTGRPSRVKARRPVSDAGPPAPHNRAMTHSTEDLHVYLRSITEGERTSLSVLARLVPANATVLDLGCGSRALGQLLAPGPAPQQGQLAGRPDDPFVGAFVPNHRSPPGGVPPACRELLKPAGRLLISV